MRPSSGPGTKNGTQIPDRVVFTDALPRNATGKVLKRDLRESFGEVLING